MTDEFNSLRLTVHASGRQITANGAVAEVVCLCVANGRYQLGFLFLFSKENLKKKVNLVHTLAPIRLSLDVPLHPQRHAAVAEFLDRSTCTPGIGLLCQTRIICKLFVGTQVNVASELSATGQSAIRHWRSVTKS